MINEPLGADDINPVHISFIAPYRFGFEQLVFRWPGKLFHVKVPALFTQALKYQREMQIATGKITGAPGRSNGDVERADQVSFRSVLLDKISGGMDADHTKVRNG